jgi:L-fuconolactonase
MTSTTDFPILDSHMHLWNPSYLHYPWLDQVTTIKRPFLLPDYRMACGAHTVTKMVFVQADCEARQNIAEINWVSSLAQQDPHIAGIVAFAPLEKGHAVLDELIELRENSLVKGIRRLIQGELDLEFCVKPAFVEGVRLLGQLDLTFDICISNKHLEKVIQLVRQCPNVRFVLDHVGNPDIEAKLFEPWATLITQLAEMENVACKISGMVTRADHQAWKIDELRPYIDHVIERFSPTRIMFGGDWPVVTLASPLSRWIDATRQLTADLSPEEQRLFFHGNANTFYRLKG